MRICLRVPDRVLRRALEDVLRSHGHEVRSLEAGDGSCDLSIALDPPSEGCTACRATLLLRPPPGAAPDAEPGRALRRVLANGGTAVWQPPLDTHRLLDVLGGAAVAERRGRGTHPDLACAPEAWMLVDPLRGRVHWANPVARRRLGARGGTPLASIEPLAPARDRLIKDSEGAVRMHFEAEERVLAWWSDGRGHRVVGLLTLPPDLSGRGPVRVEPLVEIGRMAATMAHEIRNPVASLAGALDLLEEEADPNERREIVDMARKRLRDMRTLLDDTLRLCRPLDAHPDRVGFRSALDSAASLFRADPQCRGAELEITVPDDEVELLSHAEPLRQALTNLLLNAAQAQGNRGRIQVRALRTRDRLVVRVIDEGPGIPLDRRERIFQPFYTTKPQGTGLGLAYVRRVVEASGGTIAVEDAVTGACFRIEIPLA